MDEARILLVEDNEGDIVLTKKALDKAKVNSQIDVVNDGEQALRFLHKQDEYKDAKTPDLILLDINLPKMDGLEVLAEIKNHSKLKVIPVVMLTTSEAEKDINQAYGQHANCFITKPASFTRFMEVIHSIKTFWIDIVQLPRKG